MAAGGLLALAAGGFAIWNFLLRGPVVFPRQNPCVAFLPLDNLEGQEALEAWRTALPYMISMDLVQSRVIGSWNQGDLFLNLADLKLWNVATYSDENIRRVGAKLGCGHLVTGSLARSPSGIVLTLAMRDAGSARILATFLDTSPDEAGFPAMVDRLTPQFKRALNISSRLISHDVDEHIADITTASPEAFKLYCQADRFTWLGQSQEAVLLFQRAVEIDPGFAEAYYGLFRACRGSLARGQVLEYGRQAIAHADRLNIWSRYNLIGDFYQNFDRDYDKAKDAYEKLWSLQEDDLAGYSLAQIHVDLEDYDKAIGLLEAVKNKVRDNEYIVRLLATSYAGAGDIDKAAGVLDEFLAAHPKGSAKLLQAQAVYAAAQGKMEAALTLMDRVRSEYPNTPKTFRFSKAPVYMTCDDFAGAEKELVRLAAEGEPVEKVQALIGLAGLSLTRGQAGVAESGARAAVKAAVKQGDPDGKRRAYLSLAYLERLTGDLSSALGHAEEASRWAEGSGIRALGPLYLKAWIMLEMGREEDFDRQISRIEDLVTRERYPRLMRITYLLRGQRELLKGRVLQAVDYLWRAAKMLPSPGGKIDADADSARYFSALGEAYFRVGSYKRALYWYDKVPRSWEQRINSGDVYARAYYMRAQCLDLGGEEIALAKDERDRQKAVAAENYNRFLSLWKDADRIFATEVRDARNRLTVLEGQDR
jgi:tetratricopeptide (TPR) repeat protein